MTGNDVLATLVAAAEEKVRSVLWSGPDESGEALLALIGQLEGGDWVDCVPGPLAAIWEQLSVESQLVAFLSAVTASFSVNGSERY